METTDKLIKDATQQFFILQEDNLIGDKGDLIKLKAAYNGSSYWIKANGEEHGPVYAGLQYLLDTGTIKRVEKFY